MSRRNNCICQCDEIVNLQHLTFDQVHTDDGRLTYRAKVSPVFALTLSMELSEKTVREQVKEEFKILRTELLAAFLLTAPPSDDGEPSGESGSDERSAAENGASKSVPGSDLNGFDEFLEILIVPEVDEAIVTGGYSAVAVVQAPIPDVSELPGNPDVEPGSRLKAPRPIRAGWKHIWTAKHDTTQATVRSVRSWEIVNPGHVEVDAGDDPKTVTSDTTVTIFNYSGVRAKYKISAGWNGPKKKPI